MGCMTCKHFDYIPNKEHLGRVCTVSGMMPEDECTEED